MKKAKIGDTVRLITYPEDDPDAEAKINAIYDDGRVWITNINMPFMGTINKIVSKSTFESMTGMTVDVKKIEK